LLSVVSEDETCGETKWRTRSPRYSDILCMCRNEWIRLYISYWNLQIMETLDLSRLTSVDVATLEMKWRVLVLKRLMRPVDSCVTTDDSQLFPSV
jgi:hypothetical protein